MRISVDAMGGDFAPQKVVIGALLAAEKLKGLKKLFLVGDEAAIRAELKRHPRPIPESIEIVHASEVVGMGESPAGAIRRKKDSSISVATELVKKGEAGAIVSAGNTGAAVAAAKLKLRTLKGVDRPAIATLLPSPKGLFVLLDAGANPDSTPEMLQQFAVMGCIYAQEILQISNPSVGLLSIGEEDAKGNETTKKGFSLLSKTRLNFIGNIESRDMFESRVNVAVCDGFVGNVVLKTTESVGRMTRYLLNKEFRKNPIRLLGAALGFGVFKYMKKICDPSNYGGAPLLGANGVVIISHGSADELAIFNAIRVAGEALDHKVNHLIEAELACITEA